MSDVAEASVAPLHAANSPTEILKRIGGAFRPRPLVYWADMLLSAAAGWTLFAVAAQATLGSPLHVAATVGAIFALLRAVLFIHELAHLKTSQLPGFEIVWNLVVGIPVLVPSLMYVGSHKDHHRKTGFGTQEDPEYAPIAHWSRLRIALFVITVAFVPLLLPIRWGLLGPLSRLVKPLRRVVVERMSTLVINNSYRRPMPRGAEAVARWNWEEAGAALFVWSLAGAVAAGWIAPILLLKWYLVGAGVLVVNQVRTLAAHGYENGGEPVDAEGQLLDSINLSGWVLLTGLVAPVGLRYHALHHYLPTLPYHSLGKVHRQLLAELPADSPYRRTVRPGILPTLQRLWDRAAAPA